MGKKIDLFNSDRVVTENGSEEGFLWEELSAGIQTRIANYELLMGKRIDTLPVYEGKPYFPKRYDTEVNKHLTGK